MTACAPWIEPNELGDCGCVAPPSPEVVAEAVEAASEILYTLSGRQYPGLCEAIFRPCGSHCNCEYDVCGCNRLPRVFLAWDMVTVSTVAIDDVPPLDPSAYRLENGWLVRLDGGTWPCCQNMAAELGEEGAFAVIGTRGALPTPLAIRAVKALATELVKACTPNESCALPDRVINIVRQGVQFTLLDPMEFLSSGRTGLYVVDLFLAAANPNGLQRPSRAWSPDLPVTAQYPVASS
jgi:hypothetical protein